MRNEKGQSLMEVVVALTVGILVVTALTFATLFSVRNAGFSKASIQATKLAQEGLERVRSGRDKNADITGGFQPYGNPVTEWNDDNLWSQISGSSDCIPNCYFNISSSGELQYIGTTPLSAQVVGQFKRVIILSDDLTTYSTRKKVTAVVRWTDASGPHESKLTTILGKL